MKQIRRISKIFISLLCLLSTAQAAPLVHSQYAPYAGAGGDLHYAKSMDSGATSQFLYLSMHDIPLPFQTPEFVLRAYQLNSTTGQYETMSPFVAAGPGALYSSAQYIRVGLANPSGTLLQHFYYLSGSLLGDKIGWSTINSTGSSAGKINPIAGTLTQGTGGVQGLNNATQIVITPGLTQSYLYTAGTTEGVIGIFGRNMTTGALNYIGRVGPELSNPLVSPRGLTLNSAGNRLSVVSNNRLLFFTVNTNGSLTLANDITNTCVQGIEDAVQTDNINVVFVSTTGGIRKLTRSLVTFLWTCSGPQNEFFPPFWENATVRIAPGTANGEIIASVYNFEPNFSSIAVLNWSSTSLTVLSDFYNLPSANYYLNPGPAVVTKDNQKVLVGNEGLLANFEQIDGFNIFRVDDLIFKNGFD